MPLLFVTATDTASKQTEPKQRDGEQAKGRCSIAAAHLCHTLAAYLLLLRSGDPPQLHSDFLQLEAAKHLHA